LTNDAQAAAYNAAGFEIGVHLNTGCANYTGSSLDAFFTDQMDQFGAMYPSLPAPTTHRIHCIAWSDYSTPATVSYAHGIRLETSYYYWPPAWVADRPGFFTGSGMPMRFAGTNGGIMDIYQATTQMTDESGQSYPYTVDNLLDGALGAEGYYGAFVANMHTDAEPERDADAIFSSATSRGVPIISARQLLTWVDARNASAFQSIVWDSSNTRATFSVQASPNARGLQVMLPVPPAGTNVGSVLSNGIAIPYYYASVKGLQYVMFEAGTGSYAVSFATDTTPPSISQVFPANGATDVSGNTNVTVTFSEAMNASTITTNTITVWDAASNAVPATVSYNPTNFTTVLQPNGPLGQLQTYTARVEGGTPGVTDVAGNPLPSRYEWTFITSATNLEVETTPPTVSSVSPVNGATGAGVGTVVTVTFSDAMAPTSISGSTITLQDAQNNAVGATVSYNSSTFTATLTPNALLHPNMVYTATVNGGVAGVVDATGNPLTRDFIWSFATVNQLTIWSDSTVPSTGMFADIHAYELGVKFTSDVSGNVTGIRFYKGGDGEWRDARW
jgi:hypothetical protein